MESVEVTTLFATKINTNTVYNGACVHMSNNKLERTIGGRTSMSGNKQQIFCHTPY